MIAISQSATRRASMDVPVSAELRRARKRRRWMFGSATAVGLALLTLGLSRLKPAAPMIERSTVWIDTVKRGEMLREVRGYGTLVPQDIRWIPSINAGRVERILVLPGARVQASTTLVELSNPTVEQDAFDAQWRLKGAAAELTNLRVQMKTERLALKKAVATAEADYSSAALQYEVEAGLAKSGIAPAVTVKLAKTKAEELLKVLEIERERLEASAEAAKAQLEVQEAKVAQLRAQSQLKRSQAEALKIQAGMDGVLQRLGDPNNPLQPGQQLAAGALVARIANPANLKATIKVAEAQAKDVLLEQRADIDTHSTIVRGHVTRIDPAVENGTVTVDVALHDPLPKGARPDLSVSGTIQLERLENVIYVGRPVEGQPDSQIGLFKLLPNGKAAVRVPVMLGRSSVSTTEILHGLQPGEQVILSDMSRWDTCERVRLD
jgi:HlyD family secretion protein